MKKSLTTILVLFFFAVVASWAAAAEWQIFKDAPSLSIKLVQSDMPENHPLSMSDINGPVKGFQSTMIPLTMNRLKLSFIDIAPDSDATAQAADAPPESKLELDTGIQTGSFLISDSINPSPETFGEETDWSVSTFILFFGVNLDIGPGYFQSHAFVGTPNDDRAFCPPTPGFMNKSMPLDAKGFNAIAGYKLNERIRLEAGCGYIDQKNKQAGSSEEAWAIYAQAILSLAPGFHVIPGVGQIDFDNKQTGENAQDNFFAGAKWEINF